jgi:hypothetical protein
MVRLYTVADRMSLTISGPSTGYHFALCRLLAGRKRRHRRVSENRAIEAYGAGLLVLGVSYAFGAQFLIDRYEGWIAVLLYFLLLPAVLLFWLLALGLVSIITSVLGRRAGLRIETARYIHDLLVWLITAGFAWRLTTFHSEVRWLGYAALAIIALNVAAAGILLPFTARRITRVRANLDTSG